MASAFRIVLPALRSWILPAALAVVPTLVWFRIDGHLTIDLSDEGFLWYGTTALRDGLVPHRDFQAYDPGRYVWTAAWSFLLGESLVDLRLACVLFQCVALFAGLLAARRLSKNPLFLACAAVALCVWMGPRYKVFDSSIALGSVWAGVWLLERPSIARHLAVGVLGGAAAFFGRNHGLYHLVAFGALIGWAAIGTGAGATARRLGAWAAGMFVGYLPQLAMCAVVPRYGEAFLASFDVFLQKGANLGVPVPWPWLAHAELSGWPRASVVAIGWFFAAYPGFLALALALALARGAILRRGGLAAHPVLVAAFCVGLPYAHHVFSRADLVHLAGGAPVLVLGLLALGATLLGPRTPAWGRVAEGLLAPAILAASLLATPLWTTPALEVATFPELFPTVEVRGAPMRVSLYNAAVLESARKLGADLAGPDESVLFVPNQPALYPFTGRRSPTRQIYFIHPATPEEERDVLEEIRKADVGWAMIRDYALDGRDDLRFVHTHPHVADYLRANFALVRMDGLPPGEIVVRRVRRP